MLCNRLIDFVTGMDITLPPPGHSEPSWDIVRPNQAALDLLAQHAQVLEAQLSCSRRQDHEEPPSP